MKRSVFLLAVFAAILSVAAPTARAHDLPGGRRPLKLELEGRQILHGVSFSPYRDGQEPGKAVPSDEQVLADLRLVARYWNLIRMYDATDLTERTLRLIREHRLPLRVIVGAWINGEKQPEDPARNRAEIANLIRLANAYPDVMIAAAVGNETCVWWSGHRTEPAHIVRLVREVRAAIKQPVTTADDYGFWTKEESKVVSAELDFIILHGYALWNGRPLREGISWLEEKYEETVRLHEGVPVIIGETGWATQHEPARNQPGQEGVLMQAEVSVAAQEDYLRQHYRWVERRRIPTFLFEAFDENWKGGGETTPPTVAEKHWGVFDAQRRPKASFEAIIREFYPANP